MSDSGDKRWEKRRWNKHFVKGTKRRINKKV